MTIPQVRIVAAALLLGTTACAPTLPHTGAAGAPTATGVTVLVSNHNWSDMAVYAVRSGMRQRLGTVTSMNTQRLSLPSALAAPGADLHFVADPISSDERFEIGPIQVSPGQLVEFNIENQLALSTFSVWKR